MNRIKNLGRMSRLNDKEDVVGVHVVERLKRLHAEEVDGLKDQIWKLRDEVKEAVAGRKTAEFAMEEQRVIFAGWPQPSRIGGAGRRFEVTIDVAARWEDTVPKQFFTAQLAVRSAMEQMSDHIYGLCPGLSQEVTWTITQLPKNTE